MGTVKVKSSALKLPLTFILFSASILTLYFNPSLQDPFNSPKLWILLICGCWLLGYLIFNIHFLIKIEEYRIFFILIFSFVISLLMSALLTDIKFNAFLGETQRKLGFLTYLFFAIFMIVAVISSEHKTIYKFYWANFFTGTLLGAYGVIQALGKDPIKWDNPFNRVLGTLGNPNYASATMAIIACLSTGAIFITTFSKIFRAANLILVAGLLSIASTSNSIQGLVAYSVGAGVIFVTLIYRKKKYLGHISLILFALTGVVAILGMLQVGPLKDILYKSSVTVRGYYWNAGIKMFLNNPVTGVGVDRYGAYFKEFRDSQYSINYGFDLTSSSAHNTFIQLFATAGLFVGTSYILLNIYVALRAIKLIIRSGETERIKIVGIFSAWIVFISQSVISIDNIGTTIWGWIFGGAILGLSFKHEHNYSQEQAKIKPSSSKMLLQPVVSGFFVLISIVFVSILYRGELNVVGARFYYNSQDPQNSPKFEERVNQINSMPFIDPVYKLSLAQLLAQTGKTSEAINIIDKQLVSDPRNLDSLNTKAALSEFIKDYKKAIEIRLLIDMYDPWNAKNYLQLGVDYKYLGDFNSMLEQRNRILKFAPNSEEAKTAITVLVN
jgi:O-antigen ligase